MANVRVLVVDDSAAMRALFCDILDNAKGVTVCGTAKNADDAREQLEKLKPDVLTLDVEMPGKSGMEFLEEVMETRPMPVIMLSSITQAGTGTARRALELGAVHCFPKPLHTSREEFDATVRQLGDIVLKAAAGELTPGGEDAGSGESGTRYRSDGRIVVLACGAAGIESARQVLAAYDAACPPTIVLFDADPAVVENAVRAMRHSLPCQLGDAVDGVSLEAGKVWLAHDPTRHVVVEAGAPPRLRLVDRDPVNGCRPSADLLLGSLARSGLLALGGLLTGSGADGVRGLAILAETQGKVFVQRPADYAPRDRYDAVRAHGFEHADLRQEAIADWVLEHTNANTE
ncbi:MAG: chemotaxis protein CheB [Sphingomonadales bacterium]|nr:chemotaxis protein CheB [Sphingomonadales bacterium]NCQ20441.1 chemotaxis protein CheB [Sphingomonadales bacterium]NCT03049.1 chemotaxis protein CheB [Sphingomonadales bacterium]